MADSDGILIRVRANLWRGAESVGGHLTVTRDVLSFRAHSFNVQTQPLDVPMNEVVSTSKHRSLGIVPNGLTVTLASGAAYRFVVAKRERVIASIRAAQDLSH